MSESEKDFWRKCFLRAMDMWLLKDRPEVYDDDCEPIPYLFDYCHAFADACIDEYRAAIQQANQPDSGE